jgi:hypothetical protein
MRFGQKLQSRVLKQCRLALIMDFLKLHGVEFEKQIYKVEFKRVKGNYLSNVKFRSDFAYKASKLLQLKYR